MEYGLQSAVQAHLAASYAQAPQVEAANGLFSHLQTIVERSHMIVDDLHKFADQYVGIRGDEKANNAPSPVPNGQVEGLIQTAVHLNTRLDALCQRLSIL